MDSPPPRTVPFSEEFSLFPLSAELFVQKVGVKSLEVLLLLSNARSEVNSTSSCRVEHFRCSQTGPCASLLRTSHSLSLQ